MRRSLLLAALLLLLPTLAWAQCPGVAHPVKAYASETLTISSAALPFTASVYAPAGKSPEVAVVTLETASIRYEVDGATTPTASVGHLVGPGSFVVCGGDTIRAFKAIRVTIDAAATVTYYR